MEHLLRDRAKQESGNIFSRLLTQIVAPLVNRQVSQILSAHELQQTPSSPSEPTHSDMSLDSSVTLHKVQRSLKDGWSSAVHAPIQMHQGKNNPWFGSTGQRLATLKNQVSQTAAQMQMARGRKPMTINEGEIRGLDDIFPSQVSGIFQESLPESRPAMQSPAHPAARVQAGTQTQKRDEPIRFDSSLLRKVRWPEDEAFSHPQSAHSDQTPMESELDWLAISDEVPVVPQAFMPKSAWPDSHLWPAEVMMPALQPSAQAAPMQVPTRLPQSAPPQSFVSQPPTQMEVRGPVQDEVASKPSVQSGSPVSPVSMTAKTVSESQAIPVHVTVNVEIPSAQPGPKAETSQMPQVYQVQPIQSDLAEDVLAVTLGVQRDIQKEAPQSVKEVPSPVAGPGKMESVSIGKQLKMDQELESDLSTFDYMLRNNRILSTSISGLVDEYFRKSAEEGESSYY